MTAELVCFAILAHDAPDAGARRAAARDAHLANLARYRRSGNMIDGGALLNEAGEMTGSVVLCAFADEAGIQAYLDDEPYVREHVWGSVEVRRLRRVDWDALADLG